MEPRFYDNPRADVRAHLSGHFARVLDVGCDVGRFGAGLKADGLADRVEGVELSAAADEAATRLDQVYRVDLSHSRGEIPEAAYDLILCLDVLEHMQDPWAALPRLRSLLRPEGRLVVALPNVQNFRVVLPLLRGRWDYTEHGLLDRTHLRFFTRATALELFARSGLTVENVVSLSLRRFGKVWWLNLLTLGLFRGFLEYQYLFFARIERRSGPSGRA